MIQESYEELIEREKQRQNITCELIASENFPICWIVIKKFVRKK